MAQFLCKITNLISVIIQKTALWQICTMRQHIQLLISCSISFIRANKKTCLEPGSFISAISWSKTTRISCGVSFQFNLRKFGLIKNLFLLLFLFERYKVEFNQRANPPDALLTLYNQSPSVQTRCFITIRLTTHLIVLR